MAASLVVNHRNRRSHPHLRLQGQGRGHAASSVQDALVVAHYHQAHHPLQEETTDQRESKEIITGVEVRPQALEEVAMVRREKPRDMVMDRRAAMVEISSRDCSERLEGMLTLPVKCLGKKDCKYLNRNCISSELCANSSAFFY